MSDLQNPNQTRQNCDAELSPLQLLLARLSRLLLLALLLGQLVGNLGVLLDKLGEGDERALVLMDSMFHLVNTRQRQK